MLFHNWPRHSSSSETPDKGLLNTYLMQNAGLGVREAAAPLTDERGEDEKKRKRKN